MFRPASFAYMLPDRHDFRDPQAAFSFRQLDDRHFLFIDRIGQSSLILHVPESSGDFGMKFFTDSVIVFCSSTGMASHFALLMVTKNVCCTGKGFW
jgi:hypothetical protein